VGTDPEIKPTATGKNLATFRFATTESWKDKATGERKNLVEWHTIVVFNEQIVNIVQAYVKKGTKLYIEGAIKTRVWKDPAGVDKYKTEIVLQSVTSILSLLSSSGESGAVFEPAAKKTEKVQRAVDLTDIDDDIPWG
jgi:single-strand DNA-binding protein